MCLQSQHSEGEARGSEVPGCTWAHSEFKAEIYETWLRGRERLDKYISVIPPPFGIVGD